MIRPLLDALRRRFRLPAEDRTMLYRLLEAQLRAGVVPSRVCRSLESLEGLSPAMRDVAKAGVQADLEGQSVMTGISASGLLPPDDVSVLLVAEEHGVLADAFRELVEMEDEQLGMLSQVIVPNGYYLLILGIVTTFVWNAEGYFTRLRLPDSPLVDLSLALQQHLPLGLVLAAAMGMTSWYGSRSWTGPVRRLLGPLDDTSRLQFSIRFCALAGMLSRQGAAGTVILESVLSSHRGRNFLTHHAREALHRLTGEGESLESALSGGLLRADHADLLRGMVPGETRRLYPAAFEALRQVQLEILRKRFKALFAMFRVVLIGGIVYLMSELIGGMYSIYDNTPLGG